MRSASVFSASLLLLLVGPAAPAAETELEAPTLAELMQHMAASPGVEASFRETRELALLAAPLESRGRLYFVPPDRLARYTDEPSASALFVDGSELRYREGRDGPVMDLSSSPVARAFAENLIAIFSGDLERLEELYTAAWSAGAGAWQLVLRPRRAPLDRAIATITLHGDGQGLRRVELRSTQGDLTTTVFEDAVPRRRFTPEEQKRLFSPHP